MKTQSDLLNEFRKLRKQKRYSEANDLFIYYYEHNAMSDPKYKIIYENAKTCKVIRDEFNKYDMDYFLQ